MPRQEDADVARRRVQGADEGDEEERPEVLERGEGDARQHHQKAGADQQRSTRRVTSAEPASVAVAMTPVSKGPVAELEQIDGQNQAYEAVANPPHAALQAAGAFPTRRLATGAQTARAGATRPARDHATAPAARK